MGGGVLCTILDKPANDLSYNFGEFGNKYEYLYYDLYYKANEESETNPMDNLFWYSHKNGNANPDEQVSSAAELADALWGEGGNISTIELLCNIDMSGYLWKTIDVSGLTIIGNGFEIYNVTVLFDYNFIIGVAEENNTDESILYDYFYNDCPYYNGVGMFGLMQDCAVSDLKVSGDILVAPNDEMDYILEKYSGRTISEWFPETWYVGGLAGQATETSFVNVGSEFNIYFNLQDAENKICYVGGLVGANTGYGYMSFGSSTIDYVSPDYSEISGEEDEYAIRGCYSRSYIISEANVSSDSCCGGIFGYFDGSNGGATSGLHLCYSRVYIVLNNGQWTNVGGMIGKTNIGTIWYSYSVYYEISGGENLGGMVGYLTGDMGIEQSILNSYVDVSMVQGRFGSTKSHLNGNTGQTGAFVGHTDGQNLIFRGKWDDADTSCFKYASFYENNSLSDEEYPAVGDDYSTDSWNRGMEYFYLDEWENVYRAYPSLSEWQNFYSQYVGGREFGKDEDYNCWIMGGKYWHSNPMSAGGAIAGDFGYPCLKWEAIRSRDILEIYNDEEPVCYYKYSSQNDPEYYSVRRVTDFTDMTIEDLKEYETSGSYGWNNDSDAWSQIESLNGGYKTQFSGEEFENGMQETIVPDMVIYLTPTIVQTYTVTFDGNGGTYNSQTTYSIQVEQGKSVSGPAFTKDGYYLYGWSTSSSSYSAASLSYIQKDMTVYAWWKKLYTVTYNGNGGTTSGGSSTVTDTAKQDGTFFTKSKSTFIKSGYKIVNWSTSPSSVTGSYTGVSTYYTYAANADITLYAIWEVDRDFTVRLRLYVDSNTNGTYTNPATSIIKTMIESYTVSYYYDDNGTATAQTQTKEPSSSLIDIIGMINKPFTFTFNIKGGNEFVSYKRSSTGFYNNITSSSDLYPTNYMSSSTFSFTPSSLTDDQYLYVFVRKINSNNKLLYQESSKINTINYTVTDATGTNNYGFKLNSSGYYESQNKAQSSSYALAVVSFTLNTNGSIIFKAISYGESNFDFGIFSTLDATLSASNSADSSNVYKSYKGESSATEKELVYSNVSSGTHTIYIKYIKDGSVDKDNDTLQFKLVGVASADSYFYFEDGYFPQSYVGDSLNATLNSASSGSLSLYQNLKYLDGNGVTQTIPIYTYSGNKYAKVIKGSTTKWFKVEAIRWRVGEYGVSATDYPGIWKDATGATNFMTVSDKILWVGAITTEKTTEGWKFSDSDMAKNFTEIYTKNGATLTDDAPKYAASSSEKSYYFGEIGQQEKVKHTTETVSSINIATVEDINNSAITDLRARASDMVAFILGIDDDSYCNYWTRQLGVSLNNGISVINGGIQKSAWLKNCYGVRFSLRMTEGART